MTSCCVQRHIVYVVTSCTTSRHLSTILRTFGMIRQTHQYLDPTRPDPRTSGPDPTRPIRRRTRPDPPSLPYPLTRPYPWVDPTRGQLWRIRIRCIPIIVTTRKMHPTCNIHQSINQSGFNVCFTVN